MSYIRYAVVILFLLVVMAALTSSKVPIREDYRIGSDLAEDDHNERPSKLFSSQGFFSGYGDWEPQI